MGTGSEESGPKPAPAPKPASSLRPRLDGYEFIRQIGEGGGGVVWEAQQERPARRVAIKFLRLELPVGDDTLQLLAAFSDHDAKQVKRFHREMDLLAKLEHPHVARIYGTAVTPNGVPYYVMEYVDGLPLSGWVAERPTLSTMDKVDLLIQICDGVAYAHARHVVHRDLKPGNVLVGVDGRVRVVDFGLGKHLLEDASGSKAVSRFGMIAGTPAYMSPEHASGAFAEADARSDVYSLGVMAFQLLTGQMPYVIDRDMDRSIETVLRTVPPAASSVRSELGRDIDAILAKAMDKDPEARYANARELEQDLQRFREGQPVAAKAQSRIYKLRKRLARNRSTATVLLGSVAALLLTVVASVYRIQTERTQQRARGRELAPKLVIAAREHECRNQFDDARTTLESAVMCAPELASARCMLALLCAQAGDVNTGLAQTTFMLRSVGLNPTMDSLHRLLEAEVEDPARRNPMALALLAVQQDCPALASALLREYTELPQVRSAFLRMEAEGAAPPGRAARAFLYEQCLPVWRDKINAVVPDLGPALSFHPEWGLTFRLRAQSNGPKLTSLDLLRYIPLEACVVAGFDEIDSLEPLRGMPLRRLEFAGGHIDSIEPLRGMPLENLHWDQAGDVRDWSPLAGMNLKECRINLLHTEHRGAQTDWATFRLRSCEVLRIESVIDHLGFLDHMSSIGELDIQGAPVVGEVTPILKCAGLRSLKGHPWAGQALFPVLHRISIGKPEDALARTRSLREEIGNDAVGPLRDSLDVLEHLLCRKLQVPTTVPTNELVMTLSDRRVAVIPFRANAGTLWSTLDEWRYLTERLDASLLMLRDRSEKFEVMNTLFTRFPEGGILLGARPTADKRFRWLDGTAWYEDRPRWGVVPQLDVENPVLVAFVKPSPASINFVLEESFDQIRKIGLQWHPGPPPPDAAPNGR